MTLTFHINLDSIFYLPDWVVHPTLVDLFLFQTAGAEQAGRAKGWSPAQALWVGFFKQRDFFERSEIEIRCPRCEAPLPTNHNNDKKYINNAYNNNFYNDKPPKSDNDNLTDGTEDANHNGRIDGDNGDGVLGESETWEETNPNNDDTDNDDIDDETERNNGYNAMKKDSDGDGLDDGEEDTNKNGQTESTETDPLEIDTDRDGMQDKLELDGWTVCIRFEVTGEEKSRYHVTSDPTLADTEGDGVSDFDEYKNTTDPNKADSDGDGKTDLQELTGDYNSSATGIDGEPPEIWKYDCVYKISKKKLGLLKVPSGLEVWMIVGARDIFGIDNIEIFISGLKDQKVYTNNDENVTVEFEWKLSGIDEYKRAFFKGFKINVTATDRNGNIGFRNEELDSIKDIVVNNFLGPLLDIVRIIAGLISIIVNTIIDTIKQIINTPYELFMDYFEALLIEYMDSVRNLMSKTLNGEKPSDKEYISSSSKFISVLTLSEPIGDIIEIIGNLIKKVIDLIKEKAKEIITYLKECLGMEEKKDDSSKDYLDDNRGSEVENFISTMFKIFGIDILDKIDQGLFSNEGSKLIDFSKEENFNIFLFVLPFIAFILSLIGKLGIAAFADISGNIATLNGILLGFVLFMVVRVYKIFIIPSWIPDFTWQDAETGWDFLVLLTIAMFSFILIVIAVAISLWSVYGFLCQLPQVALGNPWAAIALFIACIGYSASVYCIWLAISDLFDVLSQMGIT